MQDSPFSPLCRVVQHWVDPAKRGWVEILFLFDAQIAHVARRPGPPELARIRLAWWRAAVLDPAIATRDPVLQRAAQCDAVQREHLAAIVDGWDQITGMSGEAAWRAHGQQRGDAFFSSIAPGWSGARWAMLSAARMWPGHPDAATAGALAHALPRLPGSAPRVLRLIEGDADPRGNSLRRWWRAVRG